jgi:hypothetical protein
MTFRRLRLVLSALVFVVYVGSYLWLSRRGYEQADRWNCRGFYYLTPENTDVWRKKNSGCVYLYAPLNDLDRGLGTGRAPASEPLWGLGR